MSEGKGDEAEKGGLRMEDDLVAGLSKDFDVELKKEVTGGFRDVQGNGPRF